MIFSDILNHYNVCTFNKRCLVTGDWKHIALSSLYDAVARHKLIEELVVRDAEEMQQRKYWRFRCDRWYGGIVTADAVGCGLVCKFCWVSDKVTLEPTKVGKYCSPDVVANILINMARRRGLGQLRVSGGEPTIGKRHLFQLLTNLEGKGLRFILETNGILIGNDATYAKEFSKNDFIHVRVSLKGCNEEEFTALTGAKPEGFTLQLKALEHLLGDNISCHPAVMVSFSTERSRQELTQRLKVIDSALAENLEIEELILYPRVRQKMLRYGLDYNTAYAPSSVPKEHV
jgi:uncharacterized Fe-S cluster-containing radical SAM superfamily protein